MQPSPLHMRSGVRPRIAVRTWVLPLEIAEKLRSAFRRLADENLPNLDIVTRTLASWRAHYNEDPGRTLAADVVVDGTLDVAPTEGAVARVWTVPDSRMKAKREHRVPLSGRAALAHTVRNRPRPPTPGRTCSSAGGT